MKKIIAFEILFAKKLPVFFSGRSVDGIVVVHTSQDINIRCIKIRIHGEANTFIRMRSSSPFVNQGHGRIMMQTGSAYHYTENEVYLDRSIMLWGTSKFCFVCARLYFIRLHCSAGITFIHPH